ncbi:hypothetical protein [Bradyrhizobium sp. BRP22]|nr:hypothetical protein [Bradyrhizobium sp. BRP22]
MSHETYNSLFDPPRDLKTDYALIAVGIVAALIALTYLILT